MLDKYPKQHIKDKNGAVVGEYDALSPLQYEILHFCLAQIRGNVTEREEYCFTFTIDEVPSLYSTDTRLEINLEKEIMAFSDRLFTVEWFNQKGEPYAFQSSTWFLGVHWHSNGTIRLSFNPNCIKWFVGSDALFVL